MDGNGQPRSWSVKKSAKLYQIKGWGEPYFQVNAKGHVEVRPRGKAGPAIDLRDLMQQLADRELRHAEAIAALDHPELMPKQAKQRRRRRRVRLGELSLAACVVIWVTPPPAALPTKMSQ